MPGYFGNFTEQEPHVTSSLWTNFIKKFNVMTLKSFGELNLENFMWWILNNTILMVKFPKLYVRDN